MTLTRRVFTLTFAAVVGISSTSNAQPAAGHSSRETVAWTIAGAGGGFGIGLWAGLTTFDDSINSDRKVWTTAIVGAAVGAAAGFLVGRTRSRRQPPPAPATTRPLLPAPRIEWPRNIGVDRNIVVLPHFVS